MGDQKREASGKIAQLLKEVDAKLAEATKIADEAGVEFTYAGPARGFGGHYSPPKKEGTVANDDGWYESGWVSSSSGC